MLAFSVGCCPRIDWYRNGRKQQGTFIIQAEKANENCHYVLEGGRYKDGIRMCEDSWWIGELSDKGQRKGYYHASIFSKTNVRFQDDSLQWIGARTITNEDGRGNPALISYFDFLDFDFECGNVSL